MEHKKIMEPKIIDSEFEGRHAVVHMKDMTELLECIYEGKYFFGNNGEPGSGREEWTYGTGVVGRDNLKRALMIGETSENLIAEYHKIREEIERKAGISRFTGRGLSCRRKRVIRDDGDDLSMSRLMGGSDVYWGTTERKSKRANVRIGMNFGIAGGHGESAFARLGATLAVMSDILTKMGYAVEIIAFDFCRYNGKNNWKHFGLSIPVKSPNEPLDIHRVMTSGLQGLLRDFVFGVNKHIYKFNSSMGSQCETSDAYKEELNLLHVVEHRFCRTTDDCVDGLSEMMQKVADKPNWFHTS